MQTAAPYAVPTAVCPADDGKAVTDGGGVRYFIKCASDTSGGQAFATGTNVYSFNDCFYICTNNLGLTGGATCTAFTYTGGTNGQGAGTCYIKTASSVTFNVNGNLGAVGGIKAANYGALTTTTTTTTAAGVRYCTLCHLNNIVIASLLAWIAFPIHGRLTNIAARLEWHCRLDETFGASLTRLLGQNDPTTTTSTVRRESVWCRKLTKRSFRASACFLGRCFLY